MLNYASVPVRLCSQFNPSKTYDTYTIYGDERMWKGVADHSNLVPW